MKQVRQTFGSGLKRVRAWVPLGLALTIAGVAHAGINVWTSHGPSGGAIRALAVDPVRPHNLYAATFTSMWRSTDAGATWTAANSGLPADVIVTDLVVDPVNSNNVYAAMQSPYEVFKSTDAGASWGAANSGISEDNVYSLSIDPRTPNTLYAQAGAGVYKSTDGGASWALTNAGPGTFGLTIDPHHPDTLYTAGGLDFPGRILTSTDGGATWVAGSTIAAGGWVRTLVVDTVTANVLYAGTGLDADGAGGGLFKSTDGGVTWTAANAGLPPASDVYTVIVDPVTPHNLYTTSDQAIFKSTDGGAHWEAAIEGITSPVLRIDPLTPAILYAGTADGVLKSSDAAAHWTVAGDGINAAAVGGIAIDPLNPKTVYCTSSGHFFRSTDGGTSWKRADAGLPDSSMGVLAIDPGRPNVLYAGVASSSLGAGVFKSTDAGATWQPANAGLPENPIVEQIIIDPITPDTLYCRCDRQVFKSLDAGAHWAPAGEIQAVAALAIDPVNPDKLYASTLGFFARGDIFKSTDAGMTWVALNALNGFGTNVLAVASQTPTTVYAYKPPDGPPHFTGNGVYKSTDGGATWTAADAGFPTGYYFISSLVVDPRVPTTLYAGGSVAFKSTDAGASWTALSAGLGNSSVGTLVIDPLTPSTLYAGTQFGSVAAIQEVAVSCPGDCRGTHTVDVADVITLVGIALGTQAPSACPDGGLPVGGEVDVTVIVQAVNNALSGCGASG